MNTHFDNRIGPERPRRWRWLQRLSLPFGALVGAQTAAQAFTGDWERAAETGTVAGFATTFALLALDHRFGRTPTYVHGSARWANAQDLRRAGLLPGKRSHKPPPAPAVYVGAWTDRRGRPHYLTHSGPEHILVMAPTRSGKGVGLVLPTLLSWTESAFVTDLKGELFELTAGWRHRAGNRILRFEPASSEHSVRWNPLAEIRVRTDHEVGDVQNLALLLVDPNGKGVEGDHWRSTAMALLVGVILHALHTSVGETAEPSLATLHHLLSDPRRPIDALWQEMLDSPHPAAAAEARKMISRPEEEAGSVLSTAQRALSLYQDPVVAHNTATSDFKLRDLMHASEPVTVYLITQPVDKDRLLPLSRIFVSMTIRLLADRLHFKAGKPAPRYKHPLLMMLDEFIALRRLHILQEALAYIAAYGIKCMLVCQDRQQLTSRDYGYGPDETITANTHIQVILRPDKLETAEYISRKTGQTTITHEQRTHSGHGPFPTTSRTTQLIPRPLLTPDECMRLAGAEVHGNQIIRGGDLLVFAAGVPAIRGPQPLYFRDRTFAARAALVPPKDPVVTPLPKKTRNRTL